MGRFGPFEILKKTRLIERTDSHQCRPTADTAFVDSKSLVAENNYKVFSDV